MDLTARKAALEQTIQHATQQIGQWTERLIAARAQLALCEELAKDHAPNNGAISLDLQRFDGTPHGPNRADAY